MEKAIAGDSECMHFDYTKDVMDMMTEFRKAWKFTYPEEEQFAEIKNSTQISADNI